MGLLSDTRGTSEFWKIPMDGRPPQASLQGGDMGVYSTSISWLPDGNIAWASNGSGNGHLMRRDLQTGEDREITAGIGRERFHALSPDDRMLVFQAGEIGYDLMEVRMDGSPPTPVLSTDRDERAPSLAPDGEHFAYATDRDGTDEIWLRSRRTGPNE